MAVQWSSLRTWRRIGIGVGLTLVLLVIGVRLFARSPVAHTLVESRLSATSVRGQTVEIDGLKGDLLGKMSIQSLRISDADGVWLSASDLDIGWRPLSYLSSHLHLTEIGARSIEVARRPNLAASSASGGGVERYSLDALDLRNVSIADGVAGPAQAYRATGALQATRSDGGIQLDLTPVGESGDDIRADLSWGGAVPIEGTVALNGVPNGLVATVLQAPADAAITLDLDSSAMNGDWRLLARGAIDGTPAAAIDLEISDQRQRANGQIALDRLGVFAPLRQRFGDELSFAADLSSEDEIAASITANTFEATLSGQLKTSLRGLIIDEFNLVVENIEAARLTGVEVLTLPRLDAAGAITIRPRSIGFDGVLNAPRLEYKQYRAIDLTSDGDWTISPTSLTTEMRVNTGALTGLPGPIAALLDGPISGRFSGDFDRETQQVRARTFLLEGGALLVLGNGSATLNGAANLEGELRLTEFEPISSLQTTWALTGGSWTALQLKLDGSARLPERESLLRDVIGQDATFAATLRRSENQTALQSATIRSALMTANASGTLKDSRLDFEGQVTLPSLKLRQVNAANFDADLNLVGTLSAPRLSAIMRTDDLTISGQAFGQTRVESDVILNKDTAFFVSAAAAYLDAPLTLDIVGGRQGDQITITALDSNWRDLQATGRAEIDTQAPQNSLLELDIVGTTPVGGAVDAQINYTAEHLDTDIAISALKFGALAISQSNLGLTGTWPEFDGRLVYQAELPLFGTPQSIAGDHALIANTDTRTLSVSGAAELAGETIAMTTPLRATFTPGLKLTGEVAAYGGTASIDFDASGEARSELSLSGLQMAAFGPVLERPSLQGTLDGMFNLALLEDGLNGQGRAQISNLSRAAADMSTTDLVLDLTIVANQLAANLRTEDAADTLNFNASLSAPLKHNGTLMSARLVPDAAVPVSIQGDGAVGPLWALIAPTNLRLDGILDVDINNGDGRTWRFEGPLGLRETSFEDGITGLHLKDISADAVLRPNGIEVQSARAEGRRSGYVEAAGLYDFDGAGSVAMTLHRLNAFSRSDVSVTLSGQTEIERQNRRTQITGNLDIDQARINLEQLPGAGYTTLDIVFKDDIESDLNAAPEREAIALNLNIAADRRIFVAGSGIDTEWGLDARLTGSPGRPNVIGRATMIRGEADLLGRRFRFSDGTLRFVGAPLDTEVLVLAERTSDDITSSITLSGSLTDPEITLSSDPSLPNDEILSRVLFGRSPSELSPLQAAQLAGAAAQLAGGDGFNLLGQLQEATGLDRLDIGLNEDGAATLSTGKYVAEDIYLEIETGGTGAPGVALEWTPLDNLAVDAEIDPELGPKVAIQWKRDFDRLPGEADAE